MNLNKIRPVIITRPDGTEVEYANQTVAARGESQLGQAIISQLCRGVKKINRGYKARFKLPDHLIPLESSEVSASPTSRDSTTDVGTS